MTHKPLIYDVKLWHDDKVYTNFAWANNAAEAVRGCYFMLEKAIRKFAWEAIPRTDPNIVYMNEDAWRGRDCKYREYLDIYDEYRLKFYEMEFSNLGYTVRFSPNFQLWMEANMRGTCYLAIVDYPADPAVYLCFDTEHDAMMFKIFWK